uniref:Armadillo repeat-containing protein 2-like n=1 Tax=Phallusia mammillata TaxID=59560 RepID=A0A6F9D627_9ASCI|nr:armadillo repeat-containing protein 2-like [Phallusia mammillata]
MERPEKRHTKKQYNPIKADDKPLSSQIIKDAKEWCRLSLIETRRPSTPKDHSRSLFGADRHKFGSRPPSAVKVDAHQLDPSDPSSRPSSGAKLPPLSYTPRSSVPASEIFAGPTKQPNTAVLIAPQADKPRGNLGHDSSEFSIRRPPKKNNRSPVKAVHPGISCLSTKHEGTSNVACYHPTPPPVRPTNSKLHSNKANVVVIPTSEDDKSFQVMSGGDSASSSSSAGSFGMPSDPVARKLSPGSGNSGKTEESAEEAFYWNQNILPCIEQLQEVMHTDVQSLCTVCANLSEGLKRGSCFNHMSARRRMSLLTVLFKLLKTECPDVILSCASIILQVRVHNKNFSSICKLIFRICREKQHDELFEKYGVITPMITVIKDVQDPVTKYENYEAYLYLCGSLKFLSDNKNIANTMYMNDCVPALLHFTTATLEVNKQLRKFDEIKKLTKYATDLLVQVTTALRNMLDVDKKVQQTVQGFPTLLDAFLHFGSDEKVAWILSRIFSKLTMYSSCTTYLDSTEWPNIFLHHLGVHRQNSDVIVRLCFALGNLVARSDHLRRTLFFHQSSPDVEQGSSQCMSALVELIDIYNQQIESLDDKASSKAEKANDVLVKIVRVIANMSIGEDIGPYIACNVQVVERLLDMLETRSVEEGEELIVNLLTTLNNLSYYDGVIDSDHSNAMSAVTAQRLRLTSLLSHFMMSDNMTIVAEVARVFGNLTRHDDVRDLVHQHKVDLMMTALLDSGDRQVVYNACGVLINISADPHKRVDLLNENAVSKLTDVLRDFAPLQWRIGGVACQLLWNLCSTNDLDKNVETELIPLIKTLQHFTEYESVVELSQINAKDDRSLEFLLSTWKEDFYKYGKPLLDNLLSKTTLLEPLNQAENSAG